VGVNLALMITVTRQWFKFCSLIANLSTSITQNDEKEWGNNAVIECFGLVELSWSITI
jgi:hypothetical protein